MSYVIIIRLQLLSKISAINNPDINNNDILLQNVLQYILPIKRSFIIPDIHGVRITIHTLTFHDLLQWQ